MNSKEIREWNFIKGLKDRYISEIPRLVIFLNK
jgi:hypothetical protein